MSGQFEGRHKEGMGLECTVLQLFSIFQALQAAELKSQCYNLADYQV